LAAERRQWVDGRLFVIVALVVLVILVLLSVNLFFQYNNYSLGISTLFKHEDPGDHVMALTYSRAWDFAVVKTSSLFISFVLIFTGALYVLRAGETKISASAESGNMKGTIELTSPGLALALMGVGLVCFTLFNKSDITMSEPARTHAEETVNTKDEPADTGTAPDADNSGTPQEDSAKNPG